MEDTDFDVNVYFPSTWEGKTVDFDYDEFEAKFLAGAWKLGKKQYEKPRLATNWAYSEGVVSESEAMFECTNMQNDKELALMLIYMQVPRCGTELLSPEDRKVQATDKLPLASANQLWALTILHKHDRHSCLKVYSCKKTIQDESGLVPNGYILYLVVQKLPGITLTKDLFWGLSSPERNEIREAIKVAYQDCLGKGITNFEDDISKLQWLEGSKEVVITRFHASSPQQEDGEVWRDVVWYHWGLIDTQPDWKFMKGDSGEKLDATRWVF